jgi:shikimate kinase
MKRVLMGHRGVGKSSLLQRHKEYFPGVPSFDLDQEIEKNTGKKISDIFTKEGEPAFRHYELEAFKKIISLDNFIISVGGGFKPDQIPSDIEAIFVSRRTDSDGRVFLNRPKINSDLSDLEDSLALYQARHQNFLNRADFIYQMPEGIKEFDQVEFEILSGATTGRVQAYLTVYKNNIYQTQHHLLELRTDIFSHSEIEQIVRKSPDKEFLISFRSKENTQMFNFDREKIIYDWGLELGTPSEDFLNFNNMISIHDGQIQDCIEKLRLYPQTLLKLCPVIDSWEELILGYRWQQENPTARSFLPRTREGKSKYRWFRILSPRFQKINFVQGFSQIDDQPSWYELYKHQDNLKFGAVLGNPIHHSRSVTEQNVIAIPLEEKDFELALSFLTELGLNYAAVTSPLKKVAGDVNSLVLKKGKWLGTSTDHYGFKKLSDLIPSSLRDSIAVWGGDGVLQALKKEIPQAQFFSARTGLPKNDSHSTVPQVIIWAAPRMPEVQMPHSIYPHWNPQKVLDLNYADNSMGIECAKKYNCKYVSGLEMFLEQAKHQREFWKENL